MNIADKLNQISIDKQDIRQAIELKKGSLLDDPNNLGTYAKEISDLPIGGDEPLEPWVRPIDWIDNPSWEPVSGEAGDKFVGLFHVQPKYIDTIAIKFNGDVTIDWGDGTVENVNSNTQVEHKYDYASLPNENLTIDGYKQVLVTVTPQSGSRIGYFNLNLTLSNGRNNGSFKEVKFSGDAISTLYSAFYMQTYLENVEMIGDLGNLSTLKWTFYKCYNLKNIKFSDNLVNVTSMESTLRECYSLQNITLPDNIQSVEDMRWCFHNCYSLQNITLPDSLSNVTTLQQTFYNCYSLQSITLPSDLSNVTTMYYTFGGCYELNTVNLQNTQNVENFNLCFYLCKVLNDISVDVSSSTNSLRMFERNYLLNNLTITNIRKSIDIKYTALPRDQLVGILNNLVDLTDQEAQTCTLTGCAGVAYLTDDDKAIATNKNWNLVL